MQLPTLLCVFLFSCTLARKHAADYFTVCHRSDPDIGLCIKKVLQDMRPRLVKGIPDLNIVPIEPLVIPRIEYKEGSNNLQFKQVSTNLSIHGLGNYEVRNTTVDVDKLRMGIELWTPSLRFTSYYNISGKILLLPMSGSGDCEFNFTDVTTIADVKMRLVKRNQEDYLEVDSFDWDIDVKDVKLQFNNLFNGDPTLGKGMNDFLNENWREAFKTYKHVAEESFGILFKDFSNSVYKTFPFRELFPE